MNSIDISQARPASFPRVEGRASHARGSGPNPRHPGDLAERVAAVMATPRHGLGAAWGKRIRCI